MIRIGCREEKKNYLGSSRPEILVETFALVRAWLAYDVP